MADLSPLSEPSTPTAGANRPLLSALSRWWSPASTTSSTDVVLGYESALPWTLEDTLEGNASVHD